MKIFIPTRGRVGKQITLANLPTTLQRMTTLVCLPEEAKLHSHPNVMALPKGTKGISGARQHIIDNCSDRVCIMLDDDLEFYVSGPARPNVSTGRSLYAPKTTDLMDLFLHLDHAVRVEGFSHASVSPREGWNRYPRGHVLNTRYMRVLAYDTRVLWKENIRFDAVDLMEDFHVNLSLLRKGHKSILMTDWAQGQKGSGAQGGCSLIRNDKLQAKAAEKLAKLHKGFVKVVDREATWGGVKTVRKDVRVSWKKAFESSL